MKAESEIYGHRWWHWLPWLTRKMGVWAQVGEHEGKRAQVTRTVHCCKVCRVEFHEGQPITTTLDNYLGRPPGLKVAPTSLQPAEGGVPHNLVPLFPGFVPPPEEG